MRVKMGKKTLFEQGEEAKENVVAKKSKKTMRLWSVVGSRKKDDKIMRETAGARVCS